MPITDPKLNIVTALAEEARPIVHHFRLKRRHDIHPFAVYENLQTTLIVAGIGNLAAATATGYLAGIARSNQHAAWLNVGIAGAKRGEIGDFVLAHKISDHHHKRHYYPTLWFEHGCKTAPLITVEEPVVNYNDDVLFDMEAYGFCSAAMNFSTSELVHCCKIISDNYHVSIDNISPQSVVNWVEQNLINIQHVAESLLQGASKLNSDIKGREDAELIKSKYHFTTSQQSQLDLVLQKWFAMSDESPVNNLDFTTIKNAKDVLRELNAKLNQLPVDYQ